MKKYQTIIFDLDGTLLNTIEDIMDSLNETFSLMKLDFHMDLNLTKKFIGAGAKTLVDRVFNYFKIDCSLKENYFSLYRDIYSTHVNVKTKPFPNVIETLKCLKKKGYNLGVISNKPNRDVKKCLDEYFANIFEFVIGQMDNILPKPYPDVFYKMMEIYHFEKDSTLYVGDMNVDLIFAKNVGVDVAFFNGGYGFLEEGVKVKFAFDEYSKFINYLE